MSIEILINKINHLLEKYKAPGLPSQASNDEILKFKNEIKDKFNYIIPSAFERLLSYSNGVMFNGLVIWPTEKYWLFQESFMEANINLRDSFDERFLYIGNRDEELYIYNPKTMTYQGIEYIGDTVWVEFDDLEEMLEFMLNRSLELDEQI